MKSFALSLMIILFASQDILSNTYPISPRPLRKLVEEAKYIVVADVIRIEETEPNKYGMIDSNAILSVCEVIQGRIKETTIAVNFMPGLICPAPAHYEAGTQVLAFLDKEKKTYSTHALSYGSKTLPPEGIAVYKDRIKEMQAILRIDHENERAAHITDWLISCAKNPYTRWEGVYELSPQSDFMSFYDEDSGGYVSKYELTAAQRAELRAIALALDTVEYHDLGLIDLVTEHKDQEIEAMLVRILKTGELKKMWHRDFIMDRIVSINDRRDLKAILAQINDISYMDKKQEEKSLALAKKFIQQLE